MANAVVYVDSGAGGANNGTSWTDAYTTLTAAITASGTTGTDFYIKSTHTESAASLSLSFKGAIATPDRVFSTGTTHSPPQTSDLTFGAAFTSSTTTNLVFSGNVYAYGLSLTCGTTTGNSVFTIGSVASNDVILDSCKIFMGTSGNQSLTLGNATSSRITFINTTVKFSGGATSAIVLTRCHFRWFNTASAIDGTGTLVTTLFGASGTTGGTIAICSGVDFSALTNKAIVGAVATLQAIQLVNCKMPSGFTIGTPTFAGSVTDLIVTDSGSTNYKQQRNTYQGTLTTSTSVYNNATDGTTPISWQVITTANANPQSPFECFDIVQWAAAGTYASTKVFATSATGSLVTNDISVDVEYLGSSYPLASPATTFGAGSGSATLPQIPQGTSPGSITTGASWGTGGLGTNYELDVPSFTTSAAGYVKFTVKVGKPSLTINIDPAVTIA